MHTRPEDVHTRPEAVDTRPEDVHTPRTWDRICPDTGNKMKAATITEHTSQPHALSPPTHTSCPPSSLTSILRVTCDTGIWKFKLGLQGRDVSAVQAGSHSSRLFVLTGSLTANESAAGDYSLCCSDAWEERETTAKILHTLFFFLHFHTYSQRFMQYGNCSDRRAGGRAVYTESDRCLMDTWNFKAER